MMAPLAGRNSLTPALFLDFDGTLAPIAPRPDTVHLDPRERDLLEALGRLLPVFVISGRAFPDIESRLSVPTLSGLSGDHGAVRRFRDRLTVHPEALASREALADLASLLRERTRVVPGALLETKEFSLSLHYRGVEPEGRAPLLMGVERLFRSWRERDRFRIFEGKMVWEIRPAGGVTKEETMDYFLGLLSGETGVSPGDFFPVMVGDDTTDLAAVNHAVILGGAGFWVGNPPEGLDAGAMRLRDCAEVWIFLSRLRDLLERGGDCRELLGSPVRKV